MLSLLNVLLFLLVLATVNNPVLAQAVSIFDVTEKVLGLKEADFHNQPSKSAVLARMSYETRHNYEELKHIDREAFGFMQKLYGNAVRTAKHPSHARQAIDNVVDYYKHMTSDQLKKLHRLFPLVETIFSQYRFAGKQGSHGPSNKNPGGQNKPDNLHSHLDEEKVVLEQAGKELKKMSDAKEYTGVSEEIETLTKLRYEKWGLRDLEEILKKFKTGAEQVGSNGNKDDISRAFGFLKLLLHAFRCKGGPSTEPLDGYEKDVVDGKFENIPKVIKILLRDIRTSVSAHPQLNCMHRD